MKQSRSSKTVSLIFILIVCVFALFPFVWMMSTAFKPADEIFTYNPTFIPHHPTLSGFLSLFREKSNTVNFPRWVLNSAICAAGTSIFGMLVACFGGYGMSRYRFKGRLVLGYTILVAQVLPASLLVIPLFLVWSNIGLLDSFLGLVIMYVTFSVPFCTWMMKGFFDTIPKSLDESAKIDGANEFSVFFRVVLPLTKPGFAVTLFFSFVSGWNEFLFASICMRDYSKWTLSVGLNSFQGQYATNWTNIMAGSFMITIPLVILFLALQNHLVSGMTAGAVKQ